MISFNQSIKLSVVYTETQAIIFLLMNSMSEAYEAELKKMKSLFRCLIR